MANLVDTKPLKDYSIPIEEETYCSIIHPAIMVNNFELKPSLIDMVQQNQFIGLPLENMNLHISIFVDSCITVKASDVDQNSILFCLLPFSLRYCVRSWLQSLPANSITSYTKLKSDFLARYFLQSKTD